MRATLKHIVSRTYKPWLVRYLSKTRSYRYGSIRLEVPPEVFHPGFFFSTRLLLRYISKFSLTGKNFLELGAGNGLIAMYAAKRNARVTASDINPVAIEWLQKNAETNQLSLRVLLSDLFQNIPLQTFDIIAINPPYYKKQPESWIDYAWFCGENGEYFARLFTQLPAYMHADSMVFMTLCDSCDLDMIRTMAEQEGLSFACILTKQNLIEKNFIYQITKAKK